MKKVLLHLFIFSFIYVCNIFADDVTVETGKIRVYVDDYGAIRIYLTTSTDTIREFDRASVLVSGNPYEVIDYWNDIDTLEYNRLLANPQLGDYEVYTVLDNNYSGAPPNVIIYQTVYAWNNKQYILVKLSVVNNESSNLNTRVGLDIPGNTNNTYEDDTLYFNTSNDILYSYDSTYVGFKLFSPDLGSARIFSWFTDYENSDTNYYNMLSSDTLDTGTLITDADGSVSILGTEAYELAPGDSIVAYFGIAIGASDASLVANMNEVEGKYNSVISVSRDNNLIPLDFSLKQNYPNPFNPVTKINFSVPREGNIRLNVFNVLGEVVATLVNSELPAGNYTYDFDATKLPSGIYLYTLSAGNYKETKKMVLLK